MALLLSDSPHARKGKAPAPSAFSPNEALHRLLSPGSQRRGRTPRSQLIEEELAPVVRQGDGCLISPDSSSLHHQQQGASNVPCGPVESNGGGCVLATARVSGWSD